MDGNQTPTIDTGARTTDSSKAEGRLMVMKKLVRKYKKKDGSGGPGLVTNPLDASTLSHLASLSGRVNAKSIGGLPIATKQSTAASTKAAKKAQTTIKSAGSKLKSILKSSIHKFKAAKAPKVSKAAKAKLPKAAKSFKTISKFK